MRTASQTLHSAGRRGPHFLPQDDERENSTRANFPAPSRRRVKVVAHLDRCSLRSARRVLSGHPALVAQAARAPHKLDDWRRPAAGITSGQTAGRRHGARPHPKNSLPGRAEHAPTAAPHPNSRLLARATHPASAIRRNGPATSAHHEQGARKPKGPPPVTLSGFEPRTSAYQHHVS